MNIKMILLLAVAAAAAPQALPTSLSGYQLEAVVKSPEACSRKLGKDSAFSSVRCATISGSRRIWALVAYYSRDARGTSYESLREARIRKYGPYQRESSRAEECHPGGAELLTSYNCTVWENDRVRMTLFVSQNDELHLLKGYGVSLLSKSLEAQLKESEKEGARQKAEELLKKE